MDVPAAVADAAAAGAARGDGAGGGGGGVGGSGGAAGSSGLRQRAVGAGGGVAPAPAGGGGRPTRRAQDAAWLRERVVVPCVVVAAAAVATTALCAIALLSGRTQTLAVAAFVATLSSALLVRFAMQLGAVAAAHPHFRRGAIHRLTGERAAYVRTSQRLAMMDRDFTAADYEMLLDLDNNSTRLRRFLEGASQDFIDRLPTYTYKPDEVQEKSSTPPASPSTGTTAARVANNDERSASTSDLTRMDVTGRRCEVARERPKRAFKPELGGETMHWCAICLDNFEPGQRIRVLPCWHRFMAQCIDPWLRDQAKCPICKASIQQ